MQPYYRIRLDDLLGRDLTVQWFEGVAIVQGVCRQILADGPDQRGFPSIAEVFLCANGAIELAGTASSTASIAAAGQTLTQILGEDAPVRLRVVATRATAKDAGYQTLQEFSDDLAYFERPDAEGTLRNLHQRVLDAPPRGDVPRAFDSPAEPKQTSEQLQPAKKGHRNRLVLAGIAAGILCVAVLGFPRGSKGPAASAVAAVQNAVRSTLARVAQAEPVKKDDVEPKDKVAKNALERRVSRRLPPQKSGNDVKNPIGRSVSTLRAAEMAAPLPLRPLPMTIFRGQEVIYDAAPDGSQTPALYSALNSEVVPPKIIYPKLRGAPPSGFNLRGQMVLEMVIDTNGVVERVKLRSKPRNIHELMFVSVAKAWQFEPARLGAVPVRYLHTVVLTFQ